MPEDNSVNKSLIRDSMKVYLVEPAVGLYAFSCFLSFPLLQQFIYRRLWEDITNTTYPEFDNVTRCGKNSSNNETNYHEEVQRHASLLSLYSELFSAIPSLIVTILLVAYSDRGGRRIAMMMPVIGTILYIFFGVMAFSYCKMPQTIMVLLGFLSFIVGMVMVSFAKTTELMFFARIPMFLAAMPFPVIRSMMSKIISKAKQGALFACISCTESLAGTVSMAAFNSIYAATVAWNSSFVFLLSAGLCMIPSIIIGILIVMRVDFSTKDKEVPIEEKGLIQDQNDNPDTIN
uniref:Solute carrier family 46 member 3 n=1 Tax=Knipowitschia caucasica TaxID=637954 RepID=A0AAV2JDY5_KNICA